MSNVLRHITMSLDGFIAGPHDVMSWLADHLGGPNPTLDEVIAAIGALLTGKKLLAWLLGLVRFSSPPGHW